MTLQVLGMKVRLGAVRARELSVGVLLRDLGLHSASSGSGRRRTSRNTRKNATSSSGDVKSKTLDTELLKASDKHVSRVEW